MSEKLKSSSVILTGAASGIGRSTTLELSLNSNLKPIFAADIAPEVHSVFPKEKFPDVTTVELDVRNSYQIKEVVNRVVTETGGVGVLLNIAGVMSRGRLETYFDESGRPTQEYKDMWETNIAGPLMLIDAVRPYMREAGGGYILNITSTKYLKPEMFGNVYGQLKFLLSGITRHLADREKKFGIKVVDIQPGYTDTAIDRKKWTERSHPIEMDIWQWEMDKLRMFFAQKPDKVAKAIHAVLDGKIRDDVVVVGLESQIPYFFYRSIPSITKIFRAYIDFCIGNKINEYVIGDMVMAKLVEAVDSFQDWKRSLKP